jgi:IclR family pca regulon transcriptional regulator
VSSGPAAAPDLDGAGRNGDFVQSLERGLAVLGAFSQDHPALTLSDVARRTGLTRATARRLLLTFASLGYMGTDGRQFELTPKVLDLGYAYLSSLGIGEIAQPSMEALSEQVHESVSVAVLDGDEIVYVARVPTKRIMTISLSLGSRLPAVTTSMGRVLLADLGPGELGTFLDRVQPQARTERTITDVDELRDALAEVRRQGFALVDQELEDGVRSIATALRDRRGRAVAAINVSTHAGRVSLKELKATFLPALLSTAAEINARLAKR